MTYVKDGINTVKFQSTLLMRGATGAGVDGRRLGRISIHAPHARSDANGHASRSGATYFNPRSSCEERQVINKE